MTCFNYNSAIGEKFSSLCLVLRLVPFRKVIMTMIAMPVIAIPMMIKALQVMIIAWIIRMIANTYNDDDDDDDDTSD